MLEPIISFSTAKLAIGKGITHPLKRGFGARFYHPRTKNILWDGRTGRCKVNELYPAHTQVELQRYLRNKLFIIVTVVPLAEGFFSAKILSFNKEVGYFKRDTTASTSWEEALDQGLQTALNNL